jgi:hypothetical protein
MILLIEDAQTARQAKAAFKRYLRQAGVKAHEMGKYMSGLHIAVSNDTECETYISIGGSI